MRLLIGILVLVCLANEARSIAVMSVDLGSEWLKIGVVSPGVPMEIVLNKESKRKTPVAISFRDGERLIGEDALNIAVRFPSSAYIYFLDLLGKKHDHPSVKLFQQRFPFYDIVPDVARGTVLFRHDSETTYSVEELLSMLLSECRNYAKDFTKQPVNEVVITVPPYFNQAERRAVLNAAELAGIKVLQLINANTAAALNYGIFRRKDFNESAQTLLLYDMGASSTTATVISYQIVKTKEHGMMETNPQLSILGVGYDRTLGGLEMQLRLRDHLAKKFNELKLTKSDVFQNHRSMAKLFKEAGRLKNVLSANAAHYAQVEGLLDDKDFKSPINREEFEAMCSDLFDRVKKPIEDALKAASLTMDIVDQVILIGAGTRVPKVQEKLTEYLKRELGKSLNTDEAAAMGAVYKAADLSSGFKVKKFITKDAVVFPILVDFERHIDSEEGVTIKIVRRTLFSHMNPYPQKKILTFNKHVNDFNFYVSYGVQDNQLPLNITKVDLTGVTEALQKNPTAEGKGVKAHFNLDESGILSLTLVESVFEKNATEDEDTLSKLGSAFSNLFSGATPEAEAPTEAPPVDKPAEEAENTTAPVNGTAESATETNKTETAKNKKSVVKEPIAASTVVLDLLPLDEKKFAESADKLNRLNELDRVRTLREKARNNLEGLVLDMQDKVHSPEYEQMVTDEEREKISATCSELSDWLYEDGSDADREMLDEKFKSLKLLTKDFTDRVREHKDRPDALEALDKMLNISNSFLDSSKNLPEDQQYFTPVEVSTLETLVTETQAWRDKMVAEQEQTSLSQTPVLTIRMIADKIDSMDREVKYMLNKARVEKLKKDRERKEAEFKVKEESKDKNESAPGDTEIPAEEENEIPPSDPEVPESPGDSEPINPTESNQEEKEPTSSHTEL